jgi:twitching motility protein PilT
VIDIDQALCALVACDGSDLHLKVGSVPLARVDGELGPLTSDDWPVLEPADTGRAAPRRCSPAPSAWRNSSATTSSTSPTRSSASRASGSTSSASAAISRSSRARSRTGSAAIDELGLPSVVTELADEQRGIILVTGSTGSGKSTTLAAMIDHINSTRAAHIVTIEDPIEFVHRDLRSMISQREVGSDTHSFKRRAAPRAAPGPGRDPDRRDARRGDRGDRTLRGRDRSPRALHDSHVDAAESINRMLDFFPPHQHHQVRSMIAGTLKGVISQRLVPAAVGGRVAAVEVLRMTGRVRDMIRDPHSEAGLAQIIADGGYYGMQTFDQALLAHVRSGRVKVEDALEAATSPHDFKLMLEAEGPAAVPLTPDPNVIALAS